MNTAIPQAQQPKRKGWKRLFAGEFLIISIAAHLIFGVGAAYFVVQTITAKRKVTFTAPPPSSNPTMHAVEHQVQMAKKQQSMQQPMPARRIVSTGISNVVLPAMPAMPDLPTADPQKMQGMGAPGLNLSANTLSAGVSGGSTFSVFGLRDSRASSLVGEYYDFKRDRNGQLNGMTKEQFPEEVIRFVKSGWNDSRLQNYFKGTRKLYATRIFFPRIDSHEGPRAFGVEQNDEPPGMWVARYRGKVSPPETGTYRFVAAGDDIMYIRFDGKLVVDHCLYNQSLLKEPTLFTYPSFQYVSHGFARGEPMRLMGGQYYDIEILIGDHVPIDMWAFILIEKEGTTYQTDSGGAPILPVFRLSPDPIEKPSNGGTPPPYVEDGPVWKSRALNGF
ncbi:MAG: PA14 domain-containing protein [Chthoniobacteraceae bacterium]